MSTTLLNTTCGCAVIISDGWEAETTALVRTLEKRFGACNDVGDAIDAIVKLAKGGGVINIEMSADGTTATSDSFIGVDIAAISMDSQMYYYGTDFYKGELSDTDEERKASDTITLINDLTFGEDRVVTFIKGTIQS